MTEKQLYKALYACQGARCWNPRIIGIRHESDCLVSTEGHILAIVPFDTPPEKVGKTLLKNGQENKEIYPIWRNVVPSDPKILETFDFKRILKACNALPMFNYLDICGVVLNPVFVRKAAVLLKLFGDTCVIEVYPTCVVMTCNGAKCIIMGRVCSEGYSIDEACNIAI